MQFNSYIFILAFCPLLIVGYFGLNRVNPFYGKLYIIAADIIFYVYCGFENALVLGISILINYIFACLLCGLKSRNHGRFLLAVAIVGNIVVLFYYKYFNFAVSAIDRAFKTDLTVRNIILPLGVSFFTFQQIMYLVNVYREIIVKADVFDYLAYILYFPKLISGPLAEPAELISQFNSSERKSLNWDNLSYGIKIFSLGLFKKMILADTFSTAVAWGYDNIGTATSMEWLLIMLCYTFEIYFDFSGYSDMAVGISTMLNITLPINFDSPYKAVSIRDFWKRWHISLTSFLTRYVYIPLGGSRKGKLRTYINTFLVFCVSGIWHGANWTFILWGILHGLLNVADRLFENVQKRIFEPVRWMGTFWVVNILWLLFRSDSVSQWLLILKIILKFENTSVSDGFLDCFGIAEFTFINNELCLEPLYAAIRGFSLLLFVFSAFFLCMVPENNYKTLTKNNWKYMILSAIAFVWGFLCISTESVFVYSNF